MRRRSRRNEYLGEKLECRSMRLLEIETIREITLCNSCGCRIKDTYSDMIVQIGSNREIDPLIFRNHRGAVNGRVLDHVQ